MFFQTSFIQFPYKCYHLLFQYILQGYLTSDVGFPPQYPCKTYSLHFLVFFLKIFYKLCMLPVFPVNFKSPQTHFPVKSPQIPANICSVAFSQAGTLENLRCFCHPEKIGHILQATLQITSKGAD